MIPCATKPGMAETMGIGGHLATAAARMGKDVADGIARYCAPQRWK